MDVVEMMDGMDKSIGRIAAFVDMGAIAPRLKWGRFSLHVP